MPLFEKWREGAQQDYLLVNRVLLVSMVVVCAAILTVHFTSGATTCWLKAVCGRECIICGCTRDFIDIVSSGGQIRNKLSVWLMGLLVLEFIWRLTASCFRMDKTAAVVDAVVHVFIMSFFMYFNFMYMFDCF